MDGKIIVGEHVKPAAKKMGWKSGRDRIVWSEVALRSSHASFVVLLKQIKRGNFIEKYLENGGGYFFLCQSCLPFGFITVNYSD